MSSDFQNRLVKGLKHEATEQHPSADVLNAYSERLLPEAEERQVVAHLSVCADCREVVYLAREAVEDKPLMHPATAPAQRLRWWTWALPVTAVLIVGSTTFFLQSKRLNQNVVPPAQLAQAKRDALPPPPTAESTPLASATAPSGATPKVTEQAKDKTVLPQKKEAVPALDAPVLRNRRGTSLPTLSADASSPAAEPRFESKLKGTVSAPPPAPAPARVSANEAINVSGANALVETESVAVQAAPLEDSSAKAAAGYSLAKNKVQRADVAPTWRINNTGSLEHLLLGEWKPALNTPQAHFLAVASRGNDVWAAGKNLALYHSPDNGVHWERQALHAPDTDIVHIEFSSSTVGILKTGDAGAFSTHDGGKTWARVNLP
jgi:hypothetical protein